MPARKKINILLINLEQHFNSVDYNVAPRPFCPLYLITFSPFFAHLQCRGAGAPGGLLIFLALKVVPHTGCSLTSVTLTIQMPLHNCVFSDHQNKKSISLPHLLLHPFVFLACTQSPKVDLVCLSVSLSILYLVLHPFLLRLPPVGKRDSAWPTTGF